jgi:hypothetical protein
MERHREASISNRSHGPMARRLTTNQEIVGSIPTETFSSLPSEGTLIFAVFFFVFLCCGGGCSLAGLWRAEPDGAKVGRCRRPVLGTHSFLYLSLFVLREAYFIVNSG